MSANLYYRMMEKLVKERKARRVYEGSHVVSYELTEKGKATAIQDFFRLKEGQTVEEALKEMGEEFQKIPSGEIDPEFQERYHNLVKAFEEAKK